MKIAIMQPYFFPYIGYFQLIQAVDQFIIYDDIEYTKKGWINRNRILVNGAPVFITLPLKKDSDFLDVDQRQLALTYPQDKFKLINRIKESYKKAPFFDEVFPIIEDSFKNTNENLFEFIFYALKRVCGYLEIKTEIIISSSLGINTGLKSQDKVIELCKAVNATSYLNAIGGLELYEKDVFEKNGLTLHFIKSDQISYQQFDQKFVPWLSIIDVMMFNSRQKIQGYLKEYTIL